MVLHIENIHAYSTFLKVLASASASRGVFDIAARAS